MMSALGVTSTPVLTRPTARVARGRSNRSVSRVVVARARADAKMTAKETTKTTMVALAPVVSGACCAEAANAAVDPIASAMAIESVGLSRRRRACRWGTPPPR